MAAVRAKIKFKAIYCKSHTWIYNLNYVKKTCTPYDRFIQPHTVELTTCSKYLYRYQSSCFYDMIQLFEITVIRLVKLLSILAVT